MRALSVAAAVQIPHQLSSPLRKQVFPITTTRRDRTCFPQQLLSLRVVNSADESSNFRVVTWAAAAAKLSTTELEKEEVKSLLTSFLKELSLKDTVEFCKSDHFINHLVSKLHTIHKIGFPVGRELTLDEIRDALIPSIESLVEENLDILVKRELPIPHPTTNLPLDSIKQNAMAPVSKIQQPAGQLPPHVIDNGLDLNLMEEIICMLLDSDNYSWKENIKPLIEFILELGVSQSDIPMIIQRCPELLRTSRHELKSTVDYLYELGLSREDICKILKIYPNILRGSIDDKLRRTAEYFRSKGVDPSVLLRQRPRIWDRSLEADLKPVTEFFLDRGFSVDDIVTMVLKFPDIYAYSVEKILIPKWDFFFTMDYPRSELVMFPLYFGYSLEDRIKPRYAQLRESGVRFSLNAVLSPSNHNFEKHLNDKMKKMRDGQDSLSVNI